MSDTQVWVKPNGNKIEVNTRKETEEYMVSIGCKKKRNTKAKQSEPEATE